MVRRRAPHELSRIAHDRRRVERCVRGRRRAVERGDAHAVRQRERERKAGREVRLLRAGEPPALERLLLRVAPRHGLTRWPNVAAQERQRARRHLRHPHRVERDVERIADVRLPARVALRLEGVDDDRVPVLERAVRRGDRNPLRRPFIGEWVVELAHRVRCPSHRGAR